METALPYESAKKISLEDLSREDLIKKCKGLLVLAQKAKQAKDSLQEENNELKSKLKATPLINENATSEIIENLTQQKLLYVTTIEELKQQNNTLNNKLQKCNQDLRSCEDKNNVLDNENVSFKRQIKRLTDENEQLISHLETLEQQFEECQELGLQQQKQLLALEDNRKILEDANLKLQNENKNHLDELEKKLSESLGEIEKLQSENDMIKEKMENLKMNLVEKDKNIVTISEELQLKTNLAEELKNQIDNLQNNNETEAIIEDNKTLKAQNRDLIENNALLKQEIDEIKESKVKLRELQDTVQKQKDRLKLYHSKIVKFAENVRTLKENKNEILALFKVYVEQVEDWKNQLNVASQKLFQQMNNLKTENVELEKANQLLRESNAKFIEQLEAHKTDDEKSKEINEIENIRAENRALNEENIRLLALQEDYRNQIEMLTVEKEGFNSNLAELVEKHQEQMKICDDQSKKDTMEIQNRIEENERICIEYRKIISKLEENVDLHLRETEELKQKNFTLQEELEYLKATEKQFADKTSEEIFKLVQENAELMEMNRKLKEISLDVRESECQTDDNNSELEEAVKSLKRENAELLREMNEMNQALKERGETISKFQAHCEEIMKKLQIYETQANKNVDNISQKEETIKNLQQEIEILKKEKNINVCQHGDGDDLVKQKEIEITELRNEIESLREKLSTNLDSSYAESESMSTSTISRTEEVNRLKDLEGSWEERYGKLRNLAIKLKGKIRELTTELTKEQNEKNDIQQKCASSIKTITTLQAQCDKLEDDLELSRRQTKEYSSKLDSVAVDISKDKQKLLDNEETIANLRREIEELNQEKTNTEAWKKQISGKVQTFRKELEANKVLKKEFESKIAKLTAELEAKEQALKAESDCHKQTKNSLEYSNNERKKNSVLNLEMQDYERSVKELSQKLEKKQEQINKLKTQLDSQKSTANALREQNKLLEERAEEMKNEVAIAQAEVVAQKKQINELEEVTLQKEDKIQHYTQLLETARSENEELSTELSKVIAEHQKLTGSLKSEKEHLRSQILGLQQTLRETQDTLKLKEDELKIMQNDYVNYKVRAQSVLRQNQNRDVGLEEKLSEELSSVKVKCDGLTNELRECREMVDQLKKENEVLLQEKSESAAKCEEITSEMEDLQLLYDQLASKHQQTIIEHSETVRSLKVHAETLAQCYRQQLSEQEVRHNREVIELQSRIEKAPSPTDLPLPPLPTMHREEGEGSESTENNNKVSMHPVPLERLLGTDTDQEVAFLKKQLQEEESKVIHLTALLADTEQDLAKHAQMNKLLKEEIRRQQRSVEREKHAENLEYLKNVVFKFVTLHNGDERSRLVPVLNTILKLSPEETQKLNMVAKGDPGIKGWTNYLPLWSSSSKSS